MKPVAPVMSRFGDGMMGLIKVKRKSGTDVDVDVDVEGDQNVEGLNKVGKLSSF